MHFGMKRRVRRRGHVLTFESVSKFSPRSVDATTFSEINTAPVLLSATCEDGRKE